MRMQNQYSASSTKDARSNSPLFRRFFWGRRDITARPIKVGNMTVNTASPRTLYDKIWDLHVVKTYADGTHLLYVDRHLVQEVSSPQAFAGLSAAKRRIRRPDAQIAVADHAVPTRDRHMPMIEGLAARQVARLEENCARHSIPYT